MLSLRFKIPSQAEDDGFGEGIAGKIIEMMNTVVCCGLTNRLNKPKPFT